MAKLRSCLAAAAVAAAAVLLLLTGPGAHAINTVYVQSRGTSNRFFYNMDLSVYPTGGVQNLNDAGTCASSSIWTSITTNHTASQVGSAECPNGGTSATYHGVGCSTTCCAAFNRLENAGRLCTGTSCAHGVSAKYGGQMCIGDGCAKYATNNCPDSSASTGAGSCLGCSPAYTTDNYGNCCAQYLGEACIGTNCAQYCHGDYCGQYCIGTGCAEDSTG